MSDKDEFTDKFHEMRSRMVPPPELLARLSLSLEAEDAVGVGGRSTDVASGPIGAPTSPPQPPASKPASTRKASRPQNTRSKSRIGLFSGAATALVLASVMVVSHMTNPTSNPWPVWPDPVVVSGSSGSGQSERTSADVQAYAAIYQAVMSASPSNAGLPVLEDSAGAPTSSEKNTGGAQASSNSYTSESGTNVQVAGIDEGDIVKTDGDCLYVAKGRTVAVISAAGADSHQLATIDVAGLTSGDEIITGPVMDMMIYGKTLVVLFHGFADDVTDWSASWGDYLSLQATSLKAAFYDISDPGHPRYLSEVSQSGSYVDSRLIDGMLYLVSRYSVFTESVDPVQPVTYVPTVDPGDGPHAIDPGDITIPSWVNSPSYAMVTAIDVAARAVTSEQAVLGGADTIYMSPTNLYLASTRWGYYDYSDSPTSRVTIPGYEDFQQETTNVVRISLGDLTVDATAVLPGTLINQFALDEQNGYLRAVTTRTGDDWVQTPGLWVLDSSLTLVGSLPELVTKEQVQSVRFDGDVGYVVSFERVDPLFAIDLSDPAHPEVKSALKIPGFSSYLHPFGPQLLLGIGTDADENGRTTGLKLSMFDVSDPYDVTEVASLHIDADSTDAAYDHKAAFLDLDNGVIGFPTMSYAWTNPGGSQFSWDYHIYTWTGSRFENQSTINLFQSTDGSSPSDTTTRAVLLGDVFYLLTSSTVDAYTLPAYTQVAHVTLT